MSDKKVSTKLSQQTSNQQSKIKKSKEINIFSKIYLIIYNFAQVVG